MTKRTKKVSALAVAICTLSASVAFAANTEVVSNAVASTNATVSASALDQTAIDALRSEIDPSIFVASGTLDQIQNSLAVNDLVAVDMLNQISIDQIIALSQLLSKKTNTVEGGLAGILQPVVQAPVDDSNVSPITIDTSDDFSDGASLRSVRGTVVYMPVPNKNIGGYKMVPVTTVGANGGSVLRGSITLVGSIVKQAPVLQGSDVVSVDLPVLSQAGSGGSRVTSSSTQPTPVPEPFTMALPLVGMAFLRTLRKRNK